MCFAVSASLTNNPLILLALSMVSLGLVRLCREKASWSKSIRFYIQLALFVIAIRLIFRILFNLEVDPQSALLWLPTLEMYLGFGEPLRLLGPISPEGFLAAFTDGMRLATIILAVGMASSLANPRKLLRSTPGALYEIATAISISINLAPQLIASLNRVRKARKLRGQSEKLRSLPGIVIPVLEDTIEKSLALAASMSARGFGRRASTSKSRTATTRAIGLIAVTSLTSGIFLLLISPSQQLVDLALIGLGFACSIAYIKMSSLGSAITRYRKEPWRIGDGVLGLVGVGLLLAAFARVLA